MSGQPLVSVLVPVYNVERFVADALMSVSAQTYSNFEALIVDDGSTDGTRQVVESFLSDSRFRYIYQEHSGPSITRNNAFRHSTGNLIALLDGDDVWLPEKLENQVAIFLADSTVDLSATNFSIMSEDGTDLGCTRYAAVPKKLISDLKSALYQTCAIWTCTVMMRRESFERVGGFDETLVHGEDYDLWIRLAQSGCRFHLVMEMLAKRRLRARSQETDAIGVHRGALTVYERALACEQTSKGRRLLKRSLRHARSAVSSIESLSDLPHNPSGASRKLVRAWWYQPTRLRLLIYGLTVLCPSLLGGMLIRDRICSALKPKRWYGKDYVS